MLLKDVGRSNISYNPINSSFLMLLLSHVGEVWKKNIFLILGIFQLLWNHRKEVWKRLVKSNEEWNAWQHHAGGQWGITWSFQLAGACWWNVVIAFSVICFTALPISSPVIIILSGFCLRKQSHLGKSALLHSVSAGIKMICCEDEEEGKKIQNILSRELTRTVDQHLQFSIRKKFYLIRYWNVL